MKREEALELLKEKIKNKNLIKHCLAVEACMRKLARYFGEDEEMWGLCGLLHDLDYEETKENFKMHGYKTAEYLKDKVPQVIIDAIISHPGHKERETKMAKALYSIDPLTGLIVACALIIPEKKLGKIDKNFVLNRFREKRFAAGEDRNQIKSCEELGFSLEEFIEICLSAMKSISEKLGL